MDEKFTLRAMQQQFERLNMVLEGFMDKMDKQEEAIATLQRERV